MDPNGGTVARLTNNGALDLRGNWSPDGQKIVFTSGRDGNPELYLMNADGSNQARLTNRPAFIDDNASFSPNAQKIVFDSGALPGGAGQIFVMDANGANITQLTTSPEANYRAQFSPNGARIVFTSFRDGNAEI